MVERYVRDVEAAGSNPVTPIFYWDTAKPYVFGFAVFLLLFYPAVQFQYHRSVTGIRKQVPVLYQTVSRSLRIKTEEESNCLKYKVQV